MKGYRLRILRHGATAANANASYIGRTDLPLSSIGKKQLFEKVDSYDYQTVQKVYSSPLKRCIQTAEIIYPGRFLEKVDDLIEMDFGDFENKSADQLVDKPEFKAWLKGGIDNAPPHGECIRDVIERCFNGFDYIIKDMMKNGLTNCAVITHGGIIMNSLSCFAIPKYKPMELQCDFGEGYEILASASMWQRSNAFELLGRFPYFPESEIYNDERYDT